ncbi:MAG TPA: carbamate kinase [Acidimicrobiales bacterium]|nr:carbamate kinase [Acidimicrobiales bacterium]
MRKLAVVAIGGNSLIKDRLHQAVRDQYVAAHETSEHVAAMIEDGWDVLVGHGNGPQVGFNLRRSELAAHELHEVPLDVCGAESQGSIGYALVQNIQNVLRGHGHDKVVAAVVTQTEVAGDDPAFSHPTKPIGSFMDRAEAERRGARDGWEVALDAGRGWRRLVASPHPLRIIEIDAIRTLLDSGAVVVAVGGGGIPVVRDPHGDLYGVEAVVDKDLACALAANELGAELLLISTAVDKVALDFGTPAQTWVDHLSLAQAREYLAAGRHFAPGSMAPKVEAIIGYLERGGPRAIVTDPPNLERAMRGEAGTHFTAD